ncbi:MAG: hypothetical protein AB7H48_08065 [Parachlamydiales bacterium]
MKENEMEKPFTDILDQEDINQLKLLFILDGEETNSPFSSVISDVETDQSLLLQKDFLMHNSLNIKDKKD